MKFKVGDLITHKPLGGTGTAVDAIILKHWQTESVWSEGQNVRNLVDNVHLFITFDEDDPTAVGDIDVMCGFREQHWSLKNGV